MNLELLFKYLFGHSTGTVSLSEALSSNVILIILLVLISFATVGALYGVGTKIFGKKDAWKAVVPFYNFFVLFKSVDLNPYLSIPICLPVIGLIPLGIFNFTLPRSFGQKTNFCVLAIFFPAVIMFMLGYDKKYEYEYIKGKNVPFKDDFRTVMPEDLPKSTNGAPVPAGSLVSRSAAVAAEQAEKLRREQEEKAKKEAELKKQKEEEEKAKKQAAEEAIDVFADEKQNFGPSSAAIKFQFSTGKFNSAKEVSGEAARAVNEVREAQLRQSETTTTQTVQPAVATSSQSTEDPDAARRAATASINLRTTPAQPSVPTPPAQ